ncbi:hypothetical protein GCM10010448_45060 [Streptomyces glomeratus]|uniref:Uncharacterized protein n=1 Tax=Streptomyces glomeratus TaxID=284452 RepID=A0ABP6LWH0_9ACTN
MGMPSRTLRYSGRERPACRMNHTGVCGTGSRLHAFRKAESYVAVGWPVAGRSMALTSEVSHALPAAPPGWAAPGPGGTRARCRLRGRGCDASHRLRGRGPSDLVLLGGRARLEPLLRGRTRARLYPGGDGRNPTAPFPAKPPEASGVSPCERAFFPLLFPAWLRLRDD